jgi:hypothetical protein
VISYSPLSIPLAGSTSSITLARRDLYDARFQLLSGESREADEGDDAEDAQPSPEVLDADPDTLRFLDAPSDLVRGVYEGGLKTWECSLDLAGYLHSRLDEIMPGETEPRILEVSAPSFLADTCVGAHALLDRMRNRHPFGLRYVLSLLPSKVTLACRQNRVTRARLQPRRAVFGRSSEPYARLV